MLLVPTHCYNQLVSTAIEKYPSECCGFLLGKENDDQRIISQVIVCKNSAVSTEKEFLIVAEDYQKAEKKAEEKGLVLLGIYHSHPNSDAIPSDKDLVNALPHFSYLIISVFKQKIPASRCWRLSEHSSFEEEKVIINHNNLSKNNTAYGNHRYSHTTS